MSESTTSAAVVSNAKKDRIFKTKEEAEAAITNPRKEHVFTLTNTATQEVLYICERNYHYARSQGARHWGLLKAETSTPQSVEEIASKLTPAQREEMKALLRKKSS